MAEALELKGWTRARTGKGGARASRREGRIPGILYGDKATPQIIDVDYKAINTAAPHRALSEHDLHARPRRRQDAGDPPPGAARPHSRLPHPCRFHARRRAFAGHRRGAGALPERSRLPRHQARRHLERGAPRDPGALPGRRHPRAFRRRPDRPRDRRLRAHLGDHAARGRASRPSTERDFTVATIVGRSAEEAAPLPPLLPPSLARRKLPLRPRLLRRKTRRRTKEKKKKD